MADVKSAPVKMTVDQELAAARKRIEELEAQAKGPRTGFAIKVRELGKKYAGRDKGGELTEVEGKGNLLLYSLQRFPMSFYPRQIMTILEHKDEILKIIEDNKDKLSWKNEK